ncbi:MAG: hypothetical protein S4CHLAM7_11740 [Chlamydiae bacterium]|nr:hypothetical protein [Chlamydiota bacterium]
MKKLCFYCFTFLSLCVFNTSLSCESHASLSESQTPLPIVRSELLISEDLKFSAPFRDLLTLMDISPNLDIPNVVKETQNQWFARKERWLIEDTLAEKRAEALPLLDQLGCLKKIDPVKKQYDQAVLLGSTVYGMRPKIKQLVSLWNQGVRFEKIIFLGADCIHDLNRELPRLMNLDYSGYPFKSNWEKPEKLPQTEMEMMKCAWDQTEIPESMKNVPVVFISTPMQQKPDGSLRRANTKDTLVSWVEHEDTFEKNCLFFSIQPYVGYQDTVIRSIVPASVNIETVGLSGNENLPLNVHLDNLAKWLYSEAKMQNLY